MDGDKRDDGSALHLLAKLDSHFRDNVFPSSLLEQSAATPLVTKDAAAALAPPAISDVILVVFGGVLQEFIDVGPFENIFVENKESLFLEEWAETSKSAED